MPPGSDPASCGLCTDRPGVGRDALSLRTVGFTVAVFGLYAAAVYLPLLLGRLRPSARTLVPSRGLLLGASLAALALLAISPLAYMSPVPGEPGDAGYLWRAADRLPELAGTSLLFWALVPLGARRARRARAPCAGRLARDGLVRRLPGRGAARRLVYQKYFDPFALLALALFARPPDLRRPLDYAGIVVARDRVRRLCARRGRLSGYWIFCRSTTKTSVSFGGIAGGDPCGAVAELGRDRQLTPTADLHPGHALVPAGDHLAGAEREAEGLAAVPGGVELLAVGEVDADVLDADRVARLGGPALALDDVLLDQLARRGAGRLVDRRLDVGVLRARPSAGRSRSSWPSSRPRSRPPSSPPPPDEPSSSLPQPGGDQREQQQGEQGKSWQAHGGGSLMGRARRRRRLCAVAPEALALLENICHTRT